MNEKAILRVLLLATVGLLCVSAINVALTLRLHSIEICRFPRAVRGPLPCAALPTEYIMQYPECADHLLQAMNVTNVRIRRFNESLLSGTAETDGMDSASDGRRWPVQRVERAISGTDVR